MIKMAIATLYGIPKPKLPPFSSSRESNGNVEKGVKQFTWPTQALSTSTSCETGKLVSSWRVFTFVDGGLFFVRVTGEDFLFIPVIVISIH